MIADAVAHPEGAVQVGSFSDMPWRDARFDRGAFRLTREDGREKTDERRRWKPTRRRTVQQAPMGTAM